VEAVRLFFEGHANFMGIKSHQHGPLKLIHYYISEGPEWVRDDEFFEGKWPEKTGRTIFTLNEIYETEEGLHHHYIESSEFIPEFEELLTTYKIELLTFNQLKVIHSLWE
jgi:hypothetical protein